MLSVIARQNNQPARPISRKTTFRVKVNGKIQPITVFSMGIGCARHVPGVG